jgi:hypothetical protein
VVECLPLMCKDWLNPYHCLKLSRGSKMAAGSDSLVIVSPQTHQVEQLFMYQLTLEELRQSGERPQCLF